MSNKILAVDTNESGKFAIAIFTPTFEGEDLRQFAGQTGTYEFVTKWLEYHEAVKEYLAIELLVDWSKK